MNGGNRLPTRPLLQAWDKRGKKVADANQQRTADAFQEMLLLATYLYDIPDVDIAITT